MDDLTINYPIDKVSETKYGYFFFSEKKGKEIAKKIFPKSYFTVICLDKISKDRKFDHERMRLNLYPFRKLFKLGQILSIFLFEGKIVIKLVDKKE